MKAVTKRRLLKLVELLRALSPKKFYFGRWIGEQSKNNYLPPTYTGETDPNTCGTTACAAGWATTIPSIRKAGLRIHDGEIIFGRIFGRAGSLGSRGIRAAALAFQMTEDETGYLFLPNNEPDGICSPLDVDATAKQVARHIEKFVESDGAMP